MEQKKGKKEKGSSETMDLSDSHGFFDKYGVFLVMGGLVIYVILLAIGTFAEIFKIQSILDWWIWSPMGK
jgi:hypothetical protein